MLPKEPKLFQQILNEHHDNPQVGHLGFYKTWVMVRKHYDSPKLRKYIKRYIQECDLCQRSKNRPFSHYNLHPTEITDLPWEQIYINLLGPLPKDRETGADMIIVISDKMTKQVHFLPTTQNVNSEEVADLYLQYIWRYHGIPKRVISDRGPQFASKFMTSLLERVGSRAALSTAYHPQTDGQSE